MNEGSWPAPPAPDPWLPPAARRALGLPPAEARIGLEAHDLVSAAAAPEILLTRARRDSGGPTVPSRFLLRLEAAFGPLPGHEVAELARRLDGEGRTLFVNEPAPAPPAAERPRRIRVTEVDMLAADPFSFYARHMLRLGELDPLEQAADARIRGTIVHRILQRLVTEPGADPDILVATELAASGIDPARLLLWRPRVLRVVDWVRGQLAADRAAGWQPAGAEVPLRGEVAGIAIEGRADRIDRHAGGGLRILDYKTGELPNQGDFEAGRFRQLPLLRLLVEQAPPGDLAPAEVTELEYWKLSGGRTGGKRSGAGWNIDRTAFAADLSRLLHRYLLGTAPFRPKIAPAFATPYRSFDQLARIEEWL
jgi:ATP-dependent helicase/nuclease subunit B